MVTTYVCTRCKKKVTLYVTKVVPICVCCGIRMEAKDRNKTVQGIPPCSKKRFL